MIRELLRRTKIGLRGRLRVFRVWHRKLTALLWRRLMRPDHVVAVTGSAGKSSTVGLVSLVLATRAPTHVSMGFNTAGAIAKNVTRARSRHRFWVNEVSGHAPGAISPVASFLVHDVAVVTTVGLDHYRNFRSREAVAWEKGRLVEMLPPHGLAVLNADDPLVLAMKDRTSARVLTFGRAAEAQVRLVGSSAVYPDRLRLEIDDGESVTTIQTQMVGERWATAALAAFAVGRGLGVPARDCARAIAAWPPYLWRDSVHSYANGSTIIADTYKASHWSMASSLDIVRAARSTRKTVVVGTLSDISGTTRSKYLSVAREALDIADRVIFVGSQSERVDRLKPEAGVRLLTFDRAEHAAAYLSKTAEPGELIYIKGSAADHLERIIFDAQQPIACWVDRCDVRTSCLECRRLYADRRSKPKAFDPSETLAKSGHGVSRA
jgi:UDP-N-acetylmuramoyl-tripeptide--D-alanyl-D-alanine ligase